MKYEVTTKQGNNFIVDDNEVSLWLEMEEAFDITFTEAQEKLSRGSISVITKLLFTAAKLAEVNEFKTYKMWVENEFDKFDLVEEDPKGQSKEA